AGEEAMSGRTISRRAYAEMYGPTVGDKVRLGDTALYVEVEEDRTRYGEEVKFGGGKVIRDGMGQSQRTGKTVADTVITNALIGEPGPWNVARMLQAADDLPMNLGFLGQGNASRPEALVEQVRAGCIGLKLHEDWGTTPAAIDNCLTVADKLDVQVAIHTDTLNEGGFLEHTLAAFKGRAIHTFHTEGAGGGHAPDLIAAVGEANV